MSELKLSHVRDTFSRRDIVQGHRRNVIVPHHLGGVRIDWRERREVLIKTHVLQRLLQGNSHSTKDSLENLGMSALVCVLAYLKDDVLVAVAVSTPKEVDAVSGGGPVQDHGLVRGSCQVLLDCTPLQQGRQIVREAGTITAMYPSHLGCWSDCE